MKLKHTTTGLVFLLFTLVACRPSSPTETGADMQIPDSLSHEYVNSICLTQPQRALALMDEAERLELYPSYDIDKTRSVIYLNGFGMHRLALTYALRAYEHPLISGDPEKALPMLELIVDQELRNGNYAESIRRAIEGVEMARAAGLPQSEANLLLYIGIIKHQMTLVSEAYKYFDQAIDLLEKNAPNAKTWSDIDNLIYAYGQKISHLLSDRRYAQAVEMHPRLGEAMNRLNHFTPIPGYIDMRRANEYATYACVYFHNGDLSKAEEYYHNLLRTNYAATPEGATIKINYLLLTGQYTEALRCLQSEKQLLKTRTDTISYDYIDSHLTNEVKAYQGLANFQAVARVQATMLALADSLRLRDKQNAVLELATIYETKEKEERWQKQRLRESYYLAAFLGVVVLLVLGWIIHLKRMNTRIRRARKELEKAYTRIEKIVEVKNSFIQNMTHEIRTPLSGIIGFAQVLADKYDNCPENKEYIQIIERNSTQLLQLIGDILDVSNLESEVFNIEEVRLDDICQEAAALSSQLLKPNVEMRYTSKDKELLVKTDAQYLNRLLMNILRNAVKFTHKGSIELHTFRQEERVHIVVTDTGIGIPADKTEWVFERFAKVDSFTPGSGLGLSISRLIATNLGGSVSVDTDYTSGCRIKIELPLR